MLDYGSNAKEVSGRFGKGRPRALADFLSGFPGGPAVAQFVSPDGTRMLAICAEPGLGEEAVLSEVLGALSQHGCSVSRRDFSRLDSAVATSDLVRLARSVSRSAVGSVVVLDGLPASDEACARRQARAIRKMWDAGARVIFTLYPEASQVLDLLPECTVISSRDLLNARVISSVDHGSDVVRALSHGIPPLADALECASEDDLESARFPQSYEDTLVRQVAGSLRRSLSDEDLRLRLTMLLLGSGCFEDIAQVLGTVPLDSIDYLGQTAPFFEVDFSRRVFHTLLDDSVIGFSGVITQLESICALFGEVVSPALRVLLERGAFSRALRLFSLPGAEDAYCHVPGFGTPLLDAGGSLVISSALDSLPASSVLGRQVEALAIAASAACGENIDESVARDLAQCPDDVAVRDALLFVDARRMLQGKDALVQYSEDEWSGPGRRLLAHCEAARMLFQGRTAAAMRLLIANPCGTRIDTVSSALLCVDLEVARILLCDGGTADESRLRRAAHVLESSPCAGLAGYADCLRVLRTVLRPEGDARQLESCLARAERSGDALVQAVALVAGCIADLRGEAYARANVRSGLAVVVARGARAEFVMRVAQLLGEVARYLMGDLPSPTTQRDYPDELGEIQRLAYRVMRADEGALDAPEDDAETRIPCDALWLLLVLGDGLGSFSALFERVMPMSWRCALAVARQNAQEAEAAAGAGGDAPAPRGDGAPVSAARQGAPIRVTLLGEFGLTVHGVQILDGRIGHRNAQSMLAYLLLQRRATARRQQLVEQIWPESDYVTGSNRVYQATSALRAAIAEVDPTLDPFVLGRSTRSISIDTGMVSCDVNDFVAFAREAVDGEDDETVVRMARHVEKLYAGDLYAPPADRTGFVSAKRDELRTLYVDAMVAGSDAALHLGRKRTAARFASDAVAADDMREDAVIALVNALRADGRDIEADRHCRRYARRVNQVTGRPPSWRFRQVMRGAEGPDEARGQIAR